MGRVGNSVVLIAASIFFAAYAWMAYSGDHALAVRGVHAEATIVRYAFGKDTLEFRDQHGQVIDTVSSEVKGASWLAPGDVIQVVYDPEDPAGNVRDVRLGDRTVETVLLTLIAVTVGGFGVLEALGIVNITRWSRRWMGLPR